jgi:D-glycero-D-manno-heptose 1,7-bisphosphate phosphatase
MRAVFLDRDGVLIENVADYVKSWRDVHILPGALEAVALLARLDVKVVIVTNQSCVGRGIVPLETVERINERLVEAIRRAGGRVDALYMCPHTPDDGCDCRKPAPGMLLRAERDLGIDLAASTLIGDGAEDVWAAQAAGCRAILVLTGRGQASLKRLEAAGTPEYEVVRDVGEGVETARHRSILDSR